MCARLSGGDVSHSRFRFSSYLSYRYTWQVMLAPYPLKPITMCWRNFQATASMAKNLYPGAARPGLSVLLVAHAARQRNAVES